MLVKKLKKDMQKKADCDSVEDTNANIFKYLGLLEAEIVKVSGSASKNLAASANKMKASKPSKASMAEK